MHLVCSQCGSVNRVPQERLADGPVCGACKAALISAKPVALDDDSFAAYVSRNELPVVVDFWATWCAPCRTMAPQFAEAARQLQGKVLFAKLDTEAAQAVANQYRIRSIPTLLLFDGGAVKAQVAGARSAADIVQWVEEALSAS